MKTGILSAFLILITFTIYTNAQPFKNTDSDDVSRLKELLIQLSGESDNEYFKKHCSSILDIIEAETALTAKDSSFLSEVYTAFSDQGVSWNLSQMTSYLERKRPFIFSWTSPSDGAVSTGWLLLPVQWDPEKSYPLYVRLHGLWEPYADPVEYMSMNLKPSSSMNTTFEDGYSFFPWGRGNQWYMGKSETDIWEGMEALGNFVKIDPSRKYITGFSMGGFGAWYLGQLKPEMWAAVGVYAGALWYPDGRYLNSTAAENLRDIPVYIICGTQDGLLPNNSQAYQLLQEAGNSNLSYSTFTGGHEATLENWTDMYEWIRNFSRDLSGLSDKSLQEWFYNTPNPFHSQTTIVLSAGNRNIQELSVYNILGVKIRTLLRDEKTENAEIKVTWNGCDDSGTPVPPGLYLCRLSTPDDQFVIRIFYIR